MDSDNDSYHFPKTPGLKMAAVKIQHKNCLQSTLRKKIINTLFAGLGRSVLGKTVPEVLSTQDRGHSFSQYGAPGRQITYMYNPGKLIS